MKGKFVIYSDCNNALQKVEGLPPLQIPLQCKHVDILKDILVNCMSLTFSVEFKQICAHQDNEIDFSLLSWLAQLNCAVDAGAK